MTMSSQEFPLAAWSLLLSQGQQFLNNHLARVPVTPNQQGTHEMRDEVLSSVDAEEALDRSGYQVSAADMDDVEFYWENDQLDWDAGFRLGIDTRFSPTAFDGRRHVQQKTPFCSTKRKTKRNRLQQQQHQSLRDQDNPCIAEKLSISNENRKGSWLCVQKFVSIGIAVTVFYFKS